MAIGEVKVLQFADGVVVTPPSPGTQKAAYLVLTQQGSDPTAPVAGLTNVYAMTDGKLYYMNSDAVRRAVGSGGGGGGGADWIAPDGTGAVAAQEFSEKVLLFPKSGGQQANLWVKVPSSYSAGTQIKLNCVFYTQTGSLAFLMQTVATLIRRATPDPVNSSTNQRTSTNAAVTNTVAYGPQFVTFDLTDASGQINSVAVSPNDFIVVKLARATGSGSDTDTDDVRLIPGLTEEV